LISLPDATISRRYSALAAHQNWVVTKALDLGRHFCDDTVDKVVGRRQMRGIPSV
jgi:formate dehydrogenase assembly factor FdhD